MVCVVVPIPKEYALYTHTVARFKCSLTDKSWIEAIMTHGLVDGNPYDSAADCVYRSTERTQYPSFEDYMLGDSRPENAFEHPATRYSTAGNEQNSNTGATGVTSAGDAMRGTAMGESVGGAVGGSGVQARVQVQVQVPHRSVVPAHVSRYVTTLVPP